jgi:hypothetical protein
MHRYTYKTIRDTAELQPVIKQSFNSTLLALMFATVVHEKSWILLLVNIDGWMDAKSMVVDGVGEAELKQSEVCSHFERTS